MSQFLTFTVDTELIEFTLETLEALASRFPVAVDFLVDDNTIVSMVKYLPDDQGRVGHFKMVPDSFLCGFCHALLLASKEQKNH